MRKLTLCLLATATCATALAQTDGLFVSFHDPNTDTIALYNAITGALENSSFSSVQSPTYLALGPNNTLYVASDFLSAVDGGGIATIAINGTTAGTTQNFATHASDTSENALNNPRGMAFINGNLYVADITAGSIFVYNSSGAPQTPVPGANLQTPSGLAVSAGNLFIADEGSGDVLRFDGATVSRVNAVPNTFISATDVSLGLDGNLYVLASQHGIYQLNPTTGAAAEIVDYSTSFFQPTDLVVGPDGKLYVSGSDGLGVNGVFQYNTDGTGGTLFANTGSLTPDSLVFTPEPTTWSLTALGAALLFLPRLRAKRMRN